MALKLCALCALLCLVFAILDRSPLMLLGAAACGGWAVGR